MAAVPVNTTIQTQIANLYIAILGRNPEPAGFGFWCDTLANNGGTQAALNAITLGFSNSPEFIATYGGQTTEAAIALMYENILDRAPDAPGLAYWVAQAQSLTGTYTVQQALALTGNNMITAAAANTGTADQALIQAKEDAAITSGTTAPLTTYTLTTSADTFAPTGSSVTNGTQATFQAVDTITATGANNALKLVDSGSTGWTVPTANVSGVQTVSLQNINGSPAATDKGTIAFQTLASGKTIIVGGITVTATAGSATGEQVAQAIATGATVGTAVVTGTATGWVFNNAGGNSVAFTSTTQNAAVTPIAVTGTGTGTAQVNALYLYTASAAATDTVTFSYNGVSLTTAPIGAATTNAVSTAIANAINAYTGQTTAAVTTGGTATAAAAVTASTTVNVGTAGVSSFHVGQEVTSSVSGAVAAGTYVTAVGASTITLSAAIVTNTPLTSGATVTAGDYVTVTSSSPVNLGGFTSTSSHEVITNTSVTAYSANVATVTETAGSAPVGFTDTLDASKFVGATDFQSNVSSSAVSMTNLVQGQSVTDIGNGAVTTAALTATYKDSATAATLNLQNGVKGGAVSVTGNNIASTTVNSTGATNVIGGLTTSGAALVINATSALNTGGISNNAMTTLTVSGTAANAAKTTTNGFNASAAVDLGTLNQTVIKTVDASGLTAGGIYAALSTSAVTGFSLIGGAGNDTIKVSGAFTNVITGINGGSGTADTVIIDTAALSSATGAKFTNFEVLENKVTSNTQDATVVAGVTSVVANGDGSGFSKLTAGQAANVVVRNVAGNATFSLLDASGTSDVLGLTLENATADTAATLLLPGALTVNGIETLNVAVNGGVKSIYATGATSFSTSQNTSAFTLASADTLTAVNVTGAYAVTTTLENAALLTSFNASSNTGGLSITTGGTGANTGALTVTGSATAANLFNIGTVGTGGTQTLVGGALADYFSGTQANVAAATITGIGGIDTLRISDTTATTVISDATFLKVTGVEKFVLGATTGSDTWVAGTNVNALATANGGVWDVTASALTSGFVTIDGSTLSAGNSLKASVTVTSASAVVATVITTIYSSTSGADSITLKTVSGSGSTGSFVVDASGNSSAGVTINASAMADDLTTSSTVTLKGGSGADTIKGGTVIDTITGGAGRDALTGGTAADHFVYTTAASSLGKLNVDNITDFTSAATGAGDIVNVKNGIFGTGITITTSSTAGTSALTNTVSTTTVNSIDDVYAAITSNTSFAASNFAGTAASAGAGQIIAQTITFGSGASQGTYLVVNNGVAGFQTDGDLVIQISTIGTPTITGYDIVGIA